MHICNSLNLNKKGTQSQMCPQTHFSELLVSPVIYLKLDRSFQSKQHTKQKFNFKARTFNLKNTFTTILRKARKITRLLSSIHGHRNWKMKKIKNTCRISYILFNQSLCKILLHFLWLLSAPKKFRWESPYTTAVSLTAQRFSKYVLYSQLSDWKSLPPSLNPTFWCLKPTFHIVYSRFSTKPGSVTFRK